jgi:hypothetical protein
VRDRNNPLRNIPPGAFTIIQASHAEFHKDLADIPARYPAGQITYINNHRFQPLIKLREEHQDRLDHLEIHSLPELLLTIESDNSAILFIEYSMTWFGIDTPDEILKFNGVCRKRAQQGGPVLVITAIIDRYLLSLDGIADYFFQVGKMLPSGRRLAFREQVTLDMIPDNPSGPRERERIYGQTKIWEW